jgi:peptidoglycan-associated lipoprotein
MALGERRAAAARKYMMRMGASSERVDTISYGKERPAADGSNESAWSKNRRTEFISK